MPVSFVALSPFYFCLKMPNEQNKIRAIASLQKKMKNNSQNSSQEQKDKFKAENGLLRLKLELEHGMKHSETSSLSPEVESQWLSYIYNFEQRHREAKKIKVYEVVGSPRFKAADELLPEEVPEALKQMLSLMEAKGVMLDCSCPYDDGLIYKFITEELFDYEMDDITVDGMVHHFIYEEFHPNYSHDLQRYATEFTKNLLLRKWNPEFDTHALSHTVSYKGKEYSEKDISSIILAFQEGRSFELEKLEIQKVSFDIEKGAGEVLASLGYHSHAGQNRWFHQGIASYAFAFEYGYWYLSGFQIPGFGD